MADRSWPDDWDERMAGRGCPLCAAVGRGDNDYWVNVFTGEFAEVNLERRTRLPGYCVVVWPPASAPSSPDECSTNGARRTRLRPWSRGR